MRVSQNMEVNQRTSISPNKSTKVSQLNAGYPVLTLDAEIAEAFNNHFTNIGQSPAREVLTVGTDHFTISNLLIRYFPSK